MTNDKEGLAKDDNDEARSAPEHGDCLGAGGGAQFNKGGGEIGGKCVLRVGSQLVAAGG